MKKKGFDRAINPNDGSRRRLSSQAHKSVKKYTRKVKHKKLPDVKYEKEN